MEKELFWNIGSLMCSALVKMIKLLVKKNGNTNKWRAGIFGFDLTLPHNEEWSVCTHATTRLWV